MLGVHSDFFQKKLVAFVTGFCFLVSYEKKRGEGFVFVCLGQKPHLPIGYGRISSKEFFCFCFVRYNSSTHWSGQLLHYQTQ